MRYLILALLFLLSLILPGTLFYYWSWAGIKPDLVMLLAIYVAMHQYSLSKSILWGLGTGLLVDMYLGRYFGMYTLTLTLVCILAWWLSQRWNRENYPLTVLLVFLVTAGGQLSIGFLSAGAGLHFSSQDVFRLVLGISAYNAILVPVTYPWIHRSFIQGWLRYRPKYER